MRDLLAKPLLVVTGKGGVGKSTVAAALGVAAAGQGLRTIIAEVAARDDVHRAFGAEPSGTPRVFVEREIAERLHHISIDPESALEESRRDQLPGGLSNMLGASRMFTLLAAATPGLRELLTIGKVWELAQPDRRTPGAHPYDLVVLDAPATRAPPPPTPSSSTPPPRGTASPCSPPPAPSPTRRAWGPSRGRAG